MIGDPNWLYSTIAQSSAAIVAVIGGFITATLLRLTAEKERLVKRLAWLNSYKNSSLAPITENIEDLEREIPTLEARIETFSYPPNLKWSVAVLGYLAVFGILFPVLMIAIEAFVTWVRLLITFSFILGILGVFIYITLQITTLKKERPKEK